MSGFTAIFFTQINKGIHIRSQVLALVTDDIKLSCQRLGKGDHLYFVFINVLFDQQAGQNGYAKSLGDASDDRLCTGAFPQRMYSNLL